MLTSRPVRFVMGKGRRTAPYASARVCGLEVVPLIRKADAERGNVAHKVRRYESQVASGFMPDVGYPVEALIKEGSK